MSPLEALLEKIRVHLSVIYGEEYDPAIVDQLVEIMRIAEHFYAPTPYTNHWSEKDVTVITYGDSILDKDRPLRVLKNFLDEHLSETISTVHILPYFPWTSDDGFAISDYLSVHPDLGDWSDLESISGSYRLMSDLVINHCSASHEWFVQFEQNEEPGASYFTTVSPDADLSQVVRPRTSDLLKKVDERHVWCTFSHDQVDLNFQNPDVLLEFAKIIREHLDHGVSTFRLDAVAFIWKEIGTTCLNLPQTHEIIRLLRTLIEHVKPDAILITETNIPNRENLSYFGNFNEAHSIYNFSLPPLLLHAMTSGSCQHLKNWLMSMPPAQPGTTYFNFLASHDGIGLRPAEGLLTNEEIDELVAKMKLNGGLVSHRALSSGQARPYEINISLFDAFQGPDGLGLERFLTAHTILLALEGMPAIYIHSLLGTHNDLEKVSRTKHNRHINRKQWSLKELETELADENSSHSRVLSRLKELIRIRRQQSAFHPNATQFTLHLGEQIFAFWRQSLNRGQNIFCLHNISSNPQVISLSSVNLVATEDWIDLLSGEEIDSGATELYFEPYQSYWLTAKRQHLPY